MQAILAKRAIGHCAAGQLGAAVATYADPGQRLSLHMPRSYECRRVKVCDGKKKCYSTSRNGTEQTRVPVLLTFS